MKPVYDVVIIGADVVGSAVARELDERTKGAVIENSPFLKLFFWIINGKNAKFYF